MAALVADNLDIWTGAVERKSAAGRGGGGKRIGLYGIERLRALILKLAVLGKLVPQDPADEPAAELLTEISAERKSLQQAGTISKPKKLPPVDANNLTLPENWVAARFGAIFSLEYGDNLPERMRSGTGEYNVFGSNGVVGTHDSFRVEQPCLVIGRKGSAGAINKSDQPSWITDVAYYCVPPTGIELDFQYILFRTLGLEELGKGIKPGLNRNEANVLTVLLPPLAEQRRIVAKVDELMALCDALERESAGALAAHQTLVETLLATLLSSADFASNWARLEGHFDTLFTTEASIDALEQAILDLAMRGMLVRQDQREEQASKLLTVLQKERSKVKETKQNRIPSEPFPEPFSIPASWVWIRLGQVSELITSGSRDWSKYLSSVGAKFVTMGNLSRGSYQLRLDKMHYVQIDGHREGARTSLKAGDLLISITGDVGNMALIPEDFGEAYINQHTALVRLLPTVRGRYFPEALRSPLARKQFNGPQRGVKNSFRLSDIQNVLVPLPPLAEQHRIVAKVDELMALCDALKASIADAAETRRDVANAITQRAAA